MLNILRLAAVEKSILFIKITIMKKLFLTVLLLITINFAQAETLKGGTSYDEAIKGFFGTWHVTSKIESSNNYSMFNKMSVDIWNLSGAGDVLFLENGLTGAKSSIRLEKATENLDGKTLKFTRIKEYNQNGYKFKHIESPEFILDGKIFRGYDTFTVEKYSFDGSLISRDVVKYKVIGQKIAGD